MTRPCPYCATACVASESGLVWCRGCGNPVAIAAPTLEIAAAVNTQRRLVEFWRLEKREKERGQWVAV